jgi:hypothetical protein
MTNEKKERIAQQESAKKESGTYSSGKPTTPAEDESHHCGRPLPPATKLTDAKLLGGKLAKRDE